jgi:hypothetical protein
MVKTIFIAVFAGVLVLPQFATASNHYTVKQLDALAERVGGQFWINAPAGKAPPFLTAPASGAAAFYPADNDSFEITEMVGRANKNPYYKVQFQSGKVGYLRPEIFNEEVNASILDRDPHAEEKLKSEQAAESEKHRLEWINAQAWPQTVKEAAIKKQPVTGLTSSEVKEVLGAPRRVAKIGTGSLSKSASGSRTHGTPQVADERWYYPDGTVLHFRNNILSQVDHPSNK